jgi:hypothetical protein
MTLLDLFDSVKRVKCTKPHFFTSLQVFNHASKAALKGLVKAICWYVLMLEISERQACTYEQLAASGTTAQ